MGCYRPLFPNESIADTVIDFGWSGNFCVSPLSARCPLVKRTIRARMITDFSFAVFSDLWAFHHIIHHFGCLFCLQLLRALLYSVRCAVSVLFTIGLCTHSITHPTHALWLNAQDPSAERERTKSRSEACTAARGCSKP